MFNQQITEYSVKYTQTPLLSFHKTSALKPKQIRNWMVSSNQKRGQDDKDFPWDAALYICSDHFDRDCFERDLRVRFNRFYVLKIYYDDFSSLS